MSFLQTDDSGEFTQQITRLLLDESTDNVPLVLELIEGGGVNRRIIGYLFGIAVFHASPASAKRALELLQNHAGEDTVKQADKLREGALYHYNEAEYLKKYQNPEFDIFDFILANKMCLWHRAGNTRSPYFEISHRTLNLSNYPGEELTPAISGLHFIRHLTLPAHRTFRIESAMEYLAGMPVENLHIENLRLEAFPGSLLRLPNLRTLVVKKGTHRPRGPMFVLDENGPFNSDTLEKLTIDGYQIEGEKLMGPFPALIEVEITRCGITDLQFLRNSPKLAVMNLQQNELRTLPPYISELTQLRKIDLTNNPFTKIELDLDRMFQLEQLNISRITTEKK